MQSHVKEVMTKQPKFIRVDTLINEAAKLMADNDFGILPVSENDKIVGMITDRDITIRVTANDINPRQAKAKDIMTKEVFYCYEDDTLEKVLESFANLKIHRMPVMNRDKRLVGEISLGDIARIAKDDDKLYALIGKAKEAICEN